MIFPNLKLCPFCGSEVKFVVITFDEDPSEYDILCSKIDCIMANGTGWTVREEDVEQLADMWNTRYDESC